MQETTGYEIEEEFDAHLAATLLITGADVGRRLHNATLLQI